jgi:hypothetical protein
MDERYDMMRNLGKDWMVRPLQLVSDQDLVLEPGVTITAQRGAYCGGGDSILNAVEKWPAVIYRWTAQQRPLQLIIIDLMQEPGKGGLLGLQRLRARISQSRPCLR